MNLKHINFTENSIRWLNRNYTSKSWNTSSVISVVDDIRNFLEAAINYTQTKKPKILTRCTEQGICRFLQCINIKTHCMLCEVRMKYKNETICDKVSTKFLSGHVD